MRNPSVLLALLLLQSESSVAFPFAFSQDDIFHWFLNRGIQPAIAHTESSIGLVGYLPTTTTSAGTTTAQPTTSVTSDTTSAPQSPSTTASPTRHGPAPGIVHTEESVGISLNLGGSGGATPVTAHGEQPITTPASISIPAVDTPVGVTHQAQPTATSKTPENSTPQGNTPAAPEAHTEAPAPTTSSQAPSAPNQGSQGSSSSGGSSPEGSSPEQASSGGSGSTGSSTPSSAGSGTSHANSGSQGASAPSSPGDEESSSGDASPEIGAPGWSAAPAAVVSSAPPIAATGSAGVFNLGSATISFSAIAGGPGSQAISAIAVGSQTATPGQTLTINSQAVVVSASGSSIYFAPVATVVPQPAPSSVTKVWTEGGKVVTGVFAAPTGSQASGFNAVPTASNSLKQAGATVASAELASSAAATASIVSGMTTSTVAKPSGSSSGSGSTAAPTGAASRSLNAVTGSLVAAIAALMLLL